MRLPFLVAGTFLLSGLIFSCSHLTTPRSATQHKAGWVTGDFHEHSHFSDGGYPLDSVYTRGAYYGSNFMLNTDHGGCYPRDYDGRVWDNIPGTVFKGVDAGVDKNGNRQMWRWQELLEYSYPRVAAFQKNNPGRHYIQGLEWNSPSTSHTTTGIIANSGLPISMFEYQFDYSDLDTAGGPAEGLVKMNGRKNGNGELLSPAQRREATAAAIQWLMKHHRYNSWAFVAHPERGGDVKVGDLRHFNNAGPDVAFGFEGIPGHQKNTLRAIFYPQHAAGGGTYGGVGYYASEVGGTWDALLGEGRRFWLVASSDFHGMSSDFWPGEYHRTWIYAKDTTDPLSILEGMRSGNMYVCNGGLINALEVTAVQGGKTATLGQTLNTKPGLPVEIVIRFQTSKPNFNNTLPEVKMVHLITGDITAMTQPGTPEFENDTNPSAKVEKLFTAADWKQNGGWNEIRYTIKNPTKDFYFRVRGANHLPGTPYETDAAGNPLADSLATKHLGIDGAEEAWADLWFYSNPVFVKMKQ
ncbi:MAG: hypothetical protein J7502_10355 [Flavisolibacter sp.]|nr:hypothetical protein [Flavisolibacter sp.]